MAKAQFLPDNMALSDLSEEELLAELEKDPKTLKQLRNIGGSMLDILITGFRARRRMEPNAPDSAVWLGTFRSVAQSKEVDICTPIGLIAAVSATEAAMLLADAD